MISYVNVVIILHCVYFDTQNSFNIKCPYDTYVISRVHFTRCALYFPFSKYTNSLYYLNA